MANGKNWLSLGFKFASVIATTVGAVQHIKKADPGPEKKKAVMDALEIGIATTEFALDKDVLNDAAVKAATSNYIDVFVALQKAIAQTKEIKNKTAVN